MRGVARGDEHGGPGGNIATCGLKTLDPKPKPFKLENPTKP